MLDKNEIRREVRRRKRQFSEQQLEEQSLVVVRKLMANPRIATAATVMLYHSLPDEVYTHDVIKVLLGQGKVVLLPVVLHDGSMTLRRFVGEKSMRKGAFGISEPCGEPFTTLADIDVAVVPGMAFDTSGNRLGRGKGYYDRMLKRMPRVHTIGICFDFQLFDHLPIDSHDIAVDEVISQSKSISLV